MGAWRNARKNFPSARPYLFSSRHIYSAFRLAGERRIVARVQRAVNAITGNVLPAPIRDVMQPKKKSGHGKINIHRDTRGSEPVETGVLRAAGSKKLRPRSCLKEEKEIYSTAAATLAGPACMSAYVHFASENTLSRMNNVSSRCW